MRIRLMLAHEHDLLRAGIVQLFHSDPDIEVVAEVSCSSGLLNKLQTFYVDVLLLGMPMPAVYEGELIARIKGAHPDLPVLVLGMHDDVMSVMRAMKAGASGFINTHCAPQTLIGAIRKVATTGRYLDPKMAEQLVYARNSTALAKMESILSDRELQILPLIAEGKCIKSIANQLAISDKTVSTHKAHILCKLGLNNVADLVRYVIENESLSRIPVR
ncbi:MAG TPA: response regulator transcription factor [Gallionella sp.]|nr:response regulator transcription factor [Gallionella sp.]